MVSASRKAADFSRITVSDKSEMLMRALEKVDDCDFMVVLYQGKPGASFSNGFIVTGDPDKTIMEVNFYLDRFKMWLLGGAMRDDSKQAGEDED